MIKKTHMQEADLHVHTIYSDGMFSPEELVAKAVKLGLKGVAVTDHDCIEGVPLAIKAAEGTGLEVIPGVELSASNSSGEVHILGYFVDYNNSVLIGELERIKSERRTRMEKMLKNLKTFGIVLDEERFFSLSGEKGTIGRLSLANRMVEEGFVRDIHEAFDKYIGDRGPCYVTHKRFDYKDAIELIASSGGVAVLAHPGINTEVPDISSYVQAGLRGLEVYHTKHRRDISRKYLQIAEKYDLLVTGGSDCHGIKPDKVLLGKVRVDYEYVEKLREESHRIRREHENRG